MLAGEADGGRRTQAYPISSLEQVDLRDALEQVMRKLETKECEVLHHMAEHGYRSAIRSLGMSRRRIDKVMARVRRLAEENGLGERVGGRRDAATA